MSFITQYSDKTAALAAKSDLQITKDETGKDIAPLPDTSKGMLVTAYTTAPSADGKTPGIVSTAAFVLDPACVAQLNGTPLQLPPGIKYISPIYFGMSPPLPG